MDKTFDFWNNSLVFQNGYKGFDFVVYNPKDITFTDEEPVVEPIVLKDTEFWKQIKSYTWSSNCRFFFVVDDEYMIYGNTMDDKAFKSNLSKEIFEIYMKTASEPKLKSEKNKKS